MCLGASTLEETEKKLEGFSAKWGKKYPHIVKSWETNWEALTAFIIESVNSKFRKATAGRRVSSTEESLLKCLYMAAMKVERKRTKIKDWPHIYSQIVILFEGRI